MDRRILLCGVLFAAPHVFPVAAGASTLPPPTSLAECTASTVIDETSSCFITANDASAFGSITFAPFVSLVAESVSGPVNPQGNPAATAFVVLNYNFEITGGKPGDVVPILVATNLTTNGSSANAAYGFSEIIITTSLGGNSAVACSNGSCGNNGTSFSGTLAASTTSGEIDTIHLEIEAGSGDSLFAESANASADPFIYVDPSFGGAAQYSVLVSPGIGNALPTVPEPSTFYMLGGAVSFFVLGFARRRRSQA